MRTFIGLAVLVAAFAFATFTALREESSGGVRALSAVGLFGVALVALNLISGSGAAES